MSEDELYFNEGFSKFNEEDFEGAFIEYSLAIEINPEFVEAYLNRGLTLTELGKDKDAIADFEKALDIGSVYNEEVYLNLGTSRSNLGEHKKAIKDFTECIALNPMNEVAYFNRGNCKYNLGNIQEAIDDYGNALEINPDFTEAIQIINEIRIMYSINEN